MELNRYMSLRKSQTVIYLVPNLNRMSEYGPYYDGRFRTLSTNWKHQSICFGQFLKLALGQFRPGGHRSISRFPFWAVTRWSINLLFGTSQFDPYFRISLKLKRTFAISSNLFSVKWLLDSQTNGVKSWLTLERNVVMHPKFETEGPKHSLNS